MQAKGPLIRKVEYTSPADTNTITLEIMTTSDSRRTFQISYSDREERTQYDEGESKKRIHLRYKHNEEVLSSQATKESNDAHLRV